MTDLLSPRTATVLFTAATVAVWRNRDVRIFVIGLWVMTTTYPGMGPLH